MEFVSCHSVYKSCFDILNITGPASEWQSEVKNGFLKSSVAELVHQKKLIRVILKKLVTNAHSILAHFVNDGEDHIKLDLISKKLHWIVQGLRKNSIYPEASELVEDLELLSMRFGLYQNVKEVSRPNEQFKFKSKRYGKSKMLREVTRLVSNLLKSSEHNLASVINAANFQAAIRYLVRFVMEQHFAKHPQKSKHSKHFHTVYKCAANKGFVFRTLVEKMNAFSDKIEYLKALQILYGQLDPDSQTEFLIGLFDCHLLSLRNASSTQPPHVFTDKKTLKYCRVGSPLRLSLTNQKTNPESKKVIRSLTKALPNLGKTAASLSDHLLVYKLFFDSSMENSLPKSFVFAEFVSQILKCLEATKCITAESKTFWEEIKDKIRLFDSYRIINLSVLTWIRERTAIKDPKDIAVDNEILKYLLPELSTSASLAFVYECGDTVRRLHDDLLCRDTAINKEESERLVREQFRLLASVVANLVVQEFEQDGDKMQKRMKTISQGKH